MGWASAFTHNSGRAPHIASRHTHTHTEHSARARAMTRTSTTNPHARTCPHARATQGRMPSRTCARALTHKRAEEISEAHPRSRTHAREQPSRIHHKTRMVSPPRCPNRHMATWPATDHTPHLTHATAPGPAHRRYHHPTARASTGRLTRREPSPATPAPAGHPSGRQAAACRQSGQRTHTHARTRAGRRRTHASAHVCANLSRWCWIRREAGRRARGRDQGPARTTNANRKHRHVGRTWRVIGCRGQ